ncbi:MAG: hypothetical protein JST00_23940 [Deltaproteobacteria bacterium]|nr:hypothetical protein [Deltaproteobacteria bacterium]
MLRSPSRVRLGAVVVSITCGLFACGNPAYRAAERGDHASLKSEILAKHDRGKLTNSEAACLARAVATRELTSAKSEADTVARIKEARACALELDDALEELMKKHDGAGAEAALSRIDDGKLSNGSARDFLSDTDDRWRAVGTRTLHKGDDGDARRKAILDPSPKVRRSAIRASLDAKDPGDLDILFETARVDPELLLRNEALRAMSAIVRADEGKARAGELANRLRDLWTSGDDALREDIAVAWALSPVFENGGREALRVQIAAGKGPGAIAAAGVVVRNNAKDAELATSGAAILARTIAEGSRRDRLHAIALARPTGPELEALRKAAKDDDLDIKVPALGRLVDSKPDRDASIKELENVAGQALDVDPAKASSREEGLRDHAARARLALAYAGDLRIQAWIEKDLASPDPHRRVGAATALAALGRSARAAPLLADADPSVRTRAACTLLVAGRH